MDQWIIFLWMTDSDRQRRLMLSQEKLWGRFRLGKNMLSPLNECIEETGNNFCWVTEDSDVDVTWRLFVCFPMFFTCLTFLFKTFISWKCQPPRWNGPAAWPVVVSPWAPGRRMAAWVPWWWCCPMRRASPPTWRRWGSFGGPSSPVGCHPGSRWGMPPGE